MVAESTMAWYLANEDANGTVWRLFDHSYKLHDRRLEIGEIKW